MHKVKVEQHTFTGGMWFVAWLFTIGYLQLTAGKAILAIILWPYYLGAHFSPLLVS